MQLLFMRYGSVVFMINMYASAYPQRSVNKRGVREETYNSRLVVQPKIARVRTNVDPTIA